MTAAHCCVILAAQLINACLYIIFPLWRSAFCWMDFFQVNKTIFLTSFGRKTWVAYSKWLESETCSPFSVFLIKFDSHYYSLLFTRDLLNYELSSSKPHPASSGPSLHKIFIDFSGSFVWIRTEGLDPVYCTDSEQIVFVIIIISDSSSFQKSSALTILLHPPTPQNPYPMLLVSTEQYNSLKVNCLFNESF